MRPTVSDGHCAALVGILREGFDVDVYVDAVECVKKMGLEYEYQMEEGALTELINTRIPNLGSRGTGSACESLGNDGTICLLCLFSGSM